MRQAPRAVLLFSAWLITSTFAAHLWVTNPDSFPSLPRSFWDWADSYYQSTNAEEVADLEFIVTFAISAASLLSACLLGYALWRKLRSMR